MSPVQSFGLELLVYIDGIEAGRREVRQAGLAMVAAGRMTTEDLHPEWFPQKTVEAGTPEAEAALRTGDAIEDFTDVQWVSPADSDFEELLRLQAEMADRAISVDENESGGEWQ